MCLKKIIWLPLTIGLGLVMLFNVYSHLSDKGSLGPSGVLDLKIFRTHKVLRSILHADLCIE